MISLTWTQSHESLIEGSGMMVVNGWCIQRSNRREAVDQMADGRNSRCLFRQLLESGRRIKPAEFVLLFLLFINSALNYCSSTGPCLWRTYVVVLKSCFTSTIWCYWISIPCPTNNSHAPIFFFIFNSDRPSVEDSESLSSDIFSTQFHQSFYFA